MSIALEILEWADHGADEMVRRIPEQGSTDIKMGAQLIVQENQVALFFRDGKCLDQLGPGRHVLSTLNLPILTRALALPYGFRSPFPACVYFVNRKIFTDLKWGTKNPVVFRDRELGIVRLRGYGLFALRVEDPILFLNTVVGSRGEYGLIELEDYLRDLIVARLNDFLGEKLQTLYDLPPLYNEMAAGLKVRIRPDFERYGLELVDFYINAITPPEDVQQMMDQRTGIQAVGNLDDYLKFETGRALGGLGSGPGNGFDENGGRTSGSSPAEAGLAAGVGLGMVPALLQSLLPRTAGPQGGPQVGAQPPSSRPRETSDEKSRSTCPACGAEAMPDARFCSRCGNRLAESLCAKCGSSLPTQARFCPHCGQSRSVPDAGTAGPAGGGSPAKEHPERPSDEG